MATLGKRNNINFVPQGNAPKPGIITPKSEVIAEKTDTRASGSADPSHD